MPHREDPLITRIRREVLKRHPAFGSLSIGLRARKGVVTVKGSVETKDAAKAILKDVYLVHGVRSVNSQLEFRDGVSSGYHGRPRIGSSSSGKASSAMQGKKAENTGAATAVCRR